MRLTSDDTSVFYPWLDKLRDIYGATARRAESLDAWGALEGKEWSN